MLALFGEDDYRPFDNVTFLPAVIPAKTDML